MWQLTCGHWEEDAQSMEGEGLGLSHTVREKEKESRGDHLIL